MIQYVLFEAVHHSHSLLALFYSRDTKQQFVHGEVTEDLDEKLEQTMRPNNNNGILERSSFQLNPSA